jgi:hypothetical protein
VKVVYHEDFKASYTMDPAAADGRMEAILDVIEKRVTFVTVSYTHLTLPTIYSV